MRTSILLLISILFAIPLSAEHVDRHEAERAAVRWMASLQSGASVEAMTPVLRASATGLADTVCFVFNFAPGGFVIVSADDAAIPVLGYAREGAFRDYEGTPAGGFVRFVTRSIGQAIDERIEADERIARAWEALRNPQAFEKPAKGAAVAPLVTALWGQDEPFNLACPDSSCNRGPGSNSKTLTGCVATSLAMIMHYHKYPMSGTGSVDGYDFSAATYEWNTLPNTITSSSPASVKNEVSEIMRHIGAAVNMQYSCQASGAQLPPARDALRYYFKYHNNVQLVYRAAYADTTWNAGLQNELNNARPLVYAGLDDDISNGHAWVLDGYEVLGGTAYYHMNWGWEGIYNGNFVLSDITPGSGNYNNQQQAIVGITPSAASPRLGISQSTWTAPGTGGSSPAIQVSNIWPGDETVISYTVSSNYPWLSVSPLSGTTPGSFTITATDNSGGTSRTGSVRITATTQGVQNSPLTLSVNQPGAQGSGPTLSASMTSWQAAPGGGESPIISITNGTQGDATIIQYALTSTATWLAISPASGITPGSISLTAAPNTTGLPRTATVLISSSTPGVTNSPIGIAVLQAATSTGGGDSLVVSPAAWVAPAAGGSSPFISVSVPGKVLPFSLAINEAWLTASVSSGTTPGGFTLSATDNTGGIVRTAIVTVTVDGTAVTGSPYQFAVTQSGSTTQPVLSVSMLAWPVGNEGGTSPAIMVTNGNPTSSETIDYIVTESLPWLSITQPLGTTPGTFTLTAEPNSSGVSRSGQVEVKASSGTVLGSPWIITVTQGTGTGSSATLTVTPRFWTAPAYGGESQISVTNSSASDTRAIPYTISDDADWITLSATAGGTPGAFRITSQPNSTGATRFAVVRVVSGMSGVVGSPQDIYITQPPAAGDMPQLGVSPAIITASSAGVVAVPIQVYNAATANSEGFGFSVQDDVGWISFDILSGTAPATVRLTVSENVTNMPRSAVIPVIAEGVFQSPQYITIYQSSRLVGSSVELPMVTWNPGPGNVQSPAIHILGAGGASGIPYRVRTDAVWLSTTWTYGTTPGLFHITTAANNGGSSRTGRVYIADVQNGIAGAEHVLTVTQEGFAGHPALAISYNSWDAPIGGGNSAAVSVTNSNPGDETTIAYTASSDATWLTVNASSGNTPGQFIIRAAKNSSAASRDASVTVRSMTPGVLDGVQTIRVRQAGYTSTLLSCRTASSISPDYSARPGDTFDLTVSLSKSIFSNNLADVELSFLLHFDYSGLYPVKITGLHGNGWLERVGPGTVRAVLSGRSISAGDVLRITMEVLLGNTPYSGWSLASAGTAPSVADVGLDVTCAGEVRVQPRNGYVSRSDLGIANLHSVYPNPTLKAAPSVVVVEVDEPGDVDVRVYTAMGMEAGLVYAGYLQKGEHALELPAARLAAGVYLISMRTAAGLKTMRFVVAD